MRTTQALSQLRHIKYQLLGIAPLPRPTTYASLDAWSETDTLQYLRQTRVLAQSLIRQLSQMTDLMQPPLALPSIRTQLRAPRELDLGLNRPLHSLLAAEIQTAGSLVPRLTEFDYGPRHTEHISHVLYAALRPGTALSWDSATFNCVVGYFLDVNDLQMAFHTMKTMLECGAKPNRATLHLILKFQAQRVARNPYPSSALGHPLISTQHTLQVMDAAGVRADTATWNFVLQCMPLGFGKSFLVEEMDRRAIPLNSDSRRAILHTVIKDRNKDGDSRISKRSEAQHSTTAATERSTDISPVLLEALDPSDPGVMPLLVDHMLSRKSANNDNVKYAWQFMHTSPAPAPEVRSVSMLNVWLRRLAARRHLDWQFGVLGFFENTEWDADSWQYVLEAAAFSAECPEKYVVLGTLLKQAEREGVPLTSRARYLARRALRPNAYALRDLGPDGFKMLKTGLKWVGLFEPADPTLLDTIGFAQQNREKNNRRLPSVQVDKLDTTRFAAVPRTNDRNRQQQALQYLQLA